MAGVVSAWPRAIRAQPRHAIAPVCVCRRRLCPLSLESIMTLPASALPIESPPAFLGVARSATGKLWRDRLDARGAARALAIAQRHQLPEMLARVLAGRDVEIDAVEDFLDPTIRKLMPDPHTVTADGNGRQAHRGRGRARREGRDLRRLRCRRRHLGGAARLASAPLRARSADPHSRPHLRRLWPQYRGGARARGARARRCSSPSIAAPPASSRWRKRGSSACPSSSSTITSPATNCPRSMRWSIRTGLTISPASAISPPSGSCWSRWWR